MNLVKRVEDWHEKNHHQKIIHQLIQFPINTLSYELRGCLARAYNNNKEYDKALKILFLDEFFGLKDALWNYRVGFAYYFKKEFELAFYYFNKSAILGDEMALTYKNWCYNEILFKKWHRTTINTVEFLSDNNGDWYLLEEKQREVTALYLLEDEIANLGFLYFFSNWGYSCYASAYKALIRLGYLKCAEVIKRQFEIIFASNVKSENKNIQNIPLLLKKSDQNKIKKLDKVYINNNRFLAEKAVLYYQNELQIKKSLVKNVKVDVLYLNLDLYTKH